MYVLFVGVLSILFHEAGHVFAGLSVGARFGGCQIYANGLKSYPYVLLERTASPIRNAFVASGGILVNLMMASGMYALHLREAWVPLMLNLFCWADWKKSDPYQMLRCFREYRQSSVESGSL